MRVTLDIPEPLYRELEHRAAASRKSVSDALLEQAFGAVSDPRERFRVTLPLLAASAPGNVDLTNNLNDAFFGELGPA